MKTPFPQTLLHRWRVLGLLAALFCCAPGLQAAPVIFPGRAQNGVLVMFVVAALVLETVCVAWLLRGFRHPRFFVLWILGTHVVTFPLFVVAVWLLQAMLQDFAIALADGLVVLAEGWLIHHICRRLPSPTRLPPPALAECWFVTLIANACSLLAFWLLLVPLSDMFA